MIRKRMDLGVGAPDPRDNVGNACGGQNPTPRYVQLVDIERRGDTLSSNATMGALLGAKMPVLLVLLGFGGMCVQGCSSVQSLCGRRGSAEGFKYFQIRSFLFRLCGTTQHLNCSVKIGFTFSFRSPVPPLRPFKWNDFVSHELVPPIRPTRPIEIP
jgi:hypothetical protein